MKKFSRADLGFVILLLFFALVAFSPKVKGLVLRQLIRTGLYEPKIDHLKPREVTPADRPATKPAPSAKFRASGGETIDLADSRGKVIFLNFWATWCPPCLAEMPSVNALRSRFKDDPSVVFIMADADNNLKRSEQFMKKHDYDLPVYEPAGAIPRSIFEGTLPTTVIVNKQGEIVFFHEGMADYNSEEMARFISELAR